MICTKYCSPTTLGQQKQNNYVTSSQMLVVCVSGFEVGLQLLSVAVMKLGHGSPPSRDV